MKDYVQTKIYTKMLTYLFIFVVLGLELRAYTLSIPPALFVMDIFKIQLFAQAGIKLKSS
jgi:hypothetical protein